MSEYIKPLSEIERDPELITLLKDFYALFHRIEQHLGVIEENLDLVGNAIEDDDYGWYLRVEGSIET